MIHNLWNAVLYRPLVNALALLVGFIPGGDVGIAVILLTIFVKILLFPLAKKSIESQARMNILTPELNKIKESKASKEEQAKQTFDLYKKHQANPFSGCLLLFIQIPIIFALYYVFFKGIGFDGGILYSFVKVPVSVNFIFLGLINLSKKSLVLAILAGISQYLQALSMPKPTLSPSASSMSDSFAKSMHLQMKYVFPFVITFIAYGISGAIALYWVTSNLFMVGQQMYIKKKEFSGGVK